MRRQRSAEDLAAFTAGRQRAMAAGGADNDVPTDLKGDGLVAGALPGRGISRGGERPVSPGMVRRWEQASGARPSPDAPGFGAGSLPRQWAGGGGGSSGAWGRAGSPSAGGAREPGTAGRSASPGAERGPSTDPYRCALSRTRQAVHVQRAASHARSADRARACLELKGALAEHAICRDPVLAGAVAGHGEDGDGGGGGGVGGPDGTRGGGGGWASPHPPSRVERVVDRHGRGLPPPPGGGEAPDGDAELERLYVLALTDYSTRVPPEYGTLLELRSLLGVNRERAEWLEAQTLDTGGQFSI